jgi:replication factor C subunit 2/4
MQEPWVEKYRPKTLDEVVGNPQVVSRLQAVVRGASLPHLLLSGPPGCGKTTMILCLARQVLGEEWCSQAVLELNASDDRGIEVIRSKVKTFAQQKLSLPSGKQKIIILDEADSMTEGAQQALRRTMEIYATSTRFALACNTPSKIIEPIQSRCAVVRMRRLEDSEIAQRLEQILKLENVSWEPSGLEAIVFTADGDMRNALNNAQATVCGFGKLSQENVFKVCDQPHPILVKEILQNALDQNVNKSNEILCSLWNKGYSALDIVQTLFRIARSHEMDEQLRLQVMKAVGKTHMKVMEGCSSLIQLTALTGILSRASESTIS